MVTSFEKNHRQSPKCHSIPIATSQPVSSCVEVVTDSDPVQIQSQPVASKLGASQKWEKYKTGINKRRREKYKSTPSVFKTRSMLNYSPVRKRTRQV